MSQGCVSPRNYIYASRLWVKRWDCYSTLLPTSQVWRWIMLSSLGGSSTVEVTFFDFSSASNIVHPLSLGEKLQLTGVDMSTTFWFTDYLSGRPQSVWLGSVGSVSDCVVSFPVSVIHHTLSAQLSHGPYTSSQITMELSIECMRHKVLTLKWWRTTDTWELPSATDWTEQHGYLSLYKGINRVCFLRRLRSFNVNEEKSGCGVQHLVLLWGPLGEQCRAYNTNRLNKLIKKAAAVIGCKQENF